MLSLFTVSETWIHSFTMCFKKQALTTVSNGAKTSRLKCQRWNCFIKSFIFDLVRSVSRDFVRSSAKHPNIWFFWPLAIFGRFPMSSTNYNRSLMIYYSPQIQSKRNISIGKAVHPPLRGVRRPTWIVVPKVLLVPGHANGAKGRDIKWSDVFCSYSEKYVRNG